METELFRGRYKGQDAVFLENAHIKVALLPALGAKIASLLYKPHNFEVFYQPPAGTYTLPEYGADFSKFDTSGADEMFPTIDVCPYPESGYAGVTCPDHGELWSIPWSAELDDEKRILQTEAQGVALKYRFKRTLSLEENRLRFDYSLQNLADEPLLGIWAFHGLVACDSQTRANLPPARGTNKCEVLNVKQDDMLGEPGGIFDFPNHQMQDTVLNLDRIREKSLALTRKYYVNGEVGNGTSTLSLNRGTLEYAVTVPEKKVPYLGIWINEGGYKNEYNCALEPSTGFYDSLSMAYNNQSVLPLTALQTRTWWMEIALNELT